MGVERSRMADVFVKVAEKFPGYFCQSCQKIPGLNPSRSVPGICFMFYHISKKSCHNDWYEFLIKTETHFHVSAESVSHLLLEGSGIRFCVEFNMNGKQLQYRC